MLIEIEISLIRIRGPDTNTCNAERTRASIKYLLIRANVFNRGMFCQQIQESRKAGII